MTETQKRAQQAQEILRKAVADELEKKRRLGQYAVVFKNGRPVRLRPEQMPVRGNV